MLAEINTLNVSDLLRRKEGHIVYKRNRDFSLDLILNIIKPKRIVCLGTADCFDKLPLRNRATVLANKKRLLVKGDLENIPVYEIPHPSGSYTSNTDRESIGLSLEKLILA